MPLFRIKIGVITVVVLAAILASAFSNAPVSTAKNDDILTEIAGYRSWTRINKDPIVVQPRPSTFLVDFSGRDGG